jgi:hypothetical protein
MKSIAVQCLMGSVVSQQIHVFVLLDELSMYLIFGVGLQTSYICVR